jgi:3-hydroxyisobutyrate dehydrogenase-like beta-hydroxyacid dehydrogenase
MEVGFIGLGRMGAAMARNIAKAGHKVRGWNRSRHAGSAIEGVEMVSSPGDAFRADAVFTMLSDDAAVRDVVLSSNALRNARAGVVHVGASTISVDFADELRVSHAKAGVGYVSAPVFGSSPSSLPARRGPSTRFVPYSTSLAGRHGCSARIQNRPTPPSSPAT